ncbi:GntR family transcriptional regulator [Yinghuangia aomiensis]
MSKSRASLPQTSTVGRFLVGRRIPSEAELIATYGAARDTARRAVRHLRELGYVETRPQRGRT